MRIAYFLFTNFTDYHLINATSVLLSVVDRKKKETLKLIRMTEEGSSQQDLFRQ